MFCDVKFKVLGFWSVDDVSEGHMGSMFVTAAGHLFLDDCFPEGGASNYSETSVTLLINTDCNPEMLNFIHVFIVCSRG
jgi:hypothetical protein